MRIEHARKSLIGVDRRLRIPGSRIGAHAGFTQVDVGAAGVEAVSRYAHGASDVGPHNEAFAEAEGGEVSRLSPRALAGRRDGQQPYPVSRSFVRDLPHAEPLSQQLPVVLLADLAAPLPTDVVQVTTGWTGGLTGDRVLGVLGREDLTRGGVDVPSWDPGLLAAARDGRVEVLVDGDDVHADVLVVLEPSLLAPPALPLPALTAGRILLAAVPPGPTEPVRDLEAASATVREHWGVAPVWVARDVADQQVWQEEGWRLPLLVEEVRR